MFFLGVGLSLTGAAAPAIGLGPTQIGLLQTVQGLGVMGAVLVVGYLSDLYSKPRILAIGSIVLAVAFTLFFRWPAFGVNVVIIAFIGISMGTFEASTDALLFELYRERRGLAINVNHLFVTIGALIMTAYLTYLQLDWRRSVVQAAVAVAAVTLLYLIPGAKVHSSPKAQGTIGSRLAVLHRDRSMRVMAFAIVCAAGMEVASMGLIPTYLIRLRGYTHVAANLGLITFIVGIATGRLFVGYLTEDRHIRRNMTLLFAAATLSFAALYGLDIGRLLYPVLFLAGNSISALVPLIIAYVGLSHPTIAGTAMGAIKVGLPIGGMTAPFVISILAELFGFAVALALIPTLGALALITLLIHKE